MLHQNKQHSVTLNNGGIDWFTPDFCFYFQTQKSCKVQYVNHLAMQTFWKRCSETKSLWLISYNNRTNNFIINSSGHDSLWVYMSDGWRGLSASVATRGHPPFDVQLRRSLQMQQHKEENLLNPDNTMQKRMAESLPSLEPSMTKLARMDFPDWLIHVFKV